MNTDPISITPADCADHAAVLALNNDAVPNVNRIDLTRLAELHDLSIYFSVARAASGIAGFLLALDDTAAYDSLNFRYFQDRYPAFIYVDRVVVHPDHHRAGIGARLYADLLSCTASRATMLACEVNLEPPNAGSIRFHRQLGFVPVGEQRTEGGSKRVSLMIRDRA